jgi:hypothetical protein
VLDAVYASLAAAFGVAWLLRGSAGFAITWFALSAIFAAEAVWSVLTPYAVIDAQRLRARDRLLSGSRTVAWDEVTGLQMRGLRLDLLRDGPAFPVRLSWVRTDERGALIGEIQRRASLELDDPTRAG